MTPREANMGDGEFAVISTLTCGRLSGVDVFALRLTRGLIQRGINARILLTNPRERVPDRIDLEGDVPREALPPTKSPWRRIRLLKDYLTRHSPCIYLPQYDYETSVVSAGVPSDVAVVGIIHSDDPMHYAHLHRLGRYWNAVACVSEKITHTAAASCPTARNRLATIPYGVDLPDRVTSRDPAAPLRLLYAGRLEQNQKRVLDLPRILEEARERGLPVHLTVVGAGSLQSELESVSRNHREQGRMTLVPAVPNQEMASYYQKADVFLLTSAFEGLPVSLLEAMAHGCVPVVSDVTSGIPEVVRNGENGFRVPVGDIAQFASRLAELCRDPALRARLSLAAHQTIAARFTTDRMVASYLSLFQKTFADVRAGRFRRPWGSAEWVRLREYLGHMPLGLARRLSFLTRNHPATPATET